MCLINRQILICIHSHFFTKQEHAMPSAKAGAKAAGQIAKEVKKRVAFVCVCVV